MRLNTKGAFILITDYKNQYSLSMGNLEAESLSHDGIPTWSKLLLQIVCNLKSTLLIVSQARWLHNFILQLLRDFCFFAPYLFTCCPLLTGQGHYLLHFLCLGGHGLRLYLELRMGFTPPPPNSVTYCNMWDRKTTRNLEWKGLAGFKWQKKP